MPDRYEWIWVADERCRVATEEEITTRKCRRPYCQGIPVMAMLRSQYTKHGWRDYWWLYCDEHMYGRRIRGGVVEHRRLEEIASA